MKKPAFYSTALVLTVIYLLITMSPLAPLVIWSPRMAQAITGECVGDCRICGCSPERSASHTCCCWKKKLQYEQESDHEQVPECCRKKHKKQQTSDCCEKNERPTLPLPQMTSNCSCGSSKLVGLWGGQKFEQSFFSRFIFGINISSHDCIYILREERLIDHQGDPPDPPPKLALLS